MTVVEIQAAPLYDEIACGGLMTAASRRAIANLSVLLAQSVHAALADDGVAMGSVLCVFILRGGALLLPGFLQHMADAPYCLLALKRDPATGSATPLYASDLPNAEISAIVYVDCIAATGGTIDAARRYMTHHYRPTREMLVVIASSAAATRRLSDDGMDVLGVSLFERIEGTLLTPDLGRLDAGDILSGMALAIGQEWSLVS
jgi:uracil phosphoribosyltransferase